jgi:hypothetical protein
MSKTISRLKLAIAASALPALNTLRVASAVKDSETVTLGAEVFEVDTTVIPGITAGRKRIDLSGANSATAVAANGTLTLTGQPLNTETVTLGGKVYTFQTALTNADGNVLIGASTAASLTNLIAAITLGAGAGTGYATAMTANTSVTMVQAAGTTATVTALIPGTAGNAIASTETLTNGSFGGATLANGVDPTAAEFTTAFAASVNAQSAFYSAIRISANEVLVYTKTTGVLSHVFSETLAGSNNVWAATATPLHVGAGARVDAPVPFPVSRAATATEVALNKVHFIFPFSITEAMVQVRTSTNQTKLWDGIVTISGQRVTLDSGTGSTPIAAGDIAHVVAYN